MPAEDVSELHRLAVSRDGSIVSWTTGNPLDLVLVDTKSGDRLRTSLEMWHNNRWGFLSISPDSNDLAVKRHFDFRLLDIRDFQSQETLPAARMFSGTGLANSFLTSPDGALGAALGWNSLIRLIDLKSGEETKTLAGHSSQVFCGAFSRDGRRLLSGSLDGTVRVWDVRTGTSLATLQGHKGAVTWVGFRKEESEIVSMSLFDGTVRIWRAAGREALQQDPLYWQELAEHESRAGRGAEAIAAYDAAIRLSPENVDLLIAREELEISRTPIDATIAQLIRIIAQGGADSQFINRAKEIAGVMPLWGNSSERTLSWRYSFQKPHDQWSELGFDAAEWMVGAAPFGSRGSDATRWVGSDIWLRCEFELEAPVSESLFFRAFINDNAKFFVNGVLAAEGNWEGFKSQLIRCSSQAAATLKPGRNVLAVHCQNTGGDAGIEASLFVNQGHQRWIDLLTKALEDDPTNVHLLYSRYEAYLEHGNTELAAADADVLLPLLRDAVEAELNNRDVVWPTSAELLSDILFETYQADQPNAPLVERMHYLPSGWKRLAAAYALVGDTRSLEQLLEHLPQAAVGIGDLYAASEEWEQAVDVYNRLLSADTTNFSVLLKRADAYAGLAQWESAESDWRLAAKLNPGALQEPFNRHRLAANWQAAAKIGIVLIEQAPSDSMAWLRAAPALVLAGDEPSYREFCGRMVKQFGDTSAAPEAEVTCKACLLIPDCVAVEALPLSVFSDKLDEGAVPSGLRPWFWACRALVAYRNGDVNLASTYTPKAFESQPRPPARALTYSIAALERHGRGDFDGAREALGHANRMIEQYMPGVSASELHDFLIPLILAREAERLLEGEETPNTKANSESPPAN
jgi:tetratricopeptide (TPR) repeat protein